MIGESRSHEPHNHTKTLRRMNRTNGKDQPKRFKARPALPF